MAFVGWMDGLFAVSVRGLIADTGLLTNLLFCVLLLLFLLLLLYASITDFNNFKLFRSVCALCSISIATDSIWLYTCCNVCISTVLLCTVLCDGCIVGFGLRTLL